MQVVLIFTWSTQISYSLMFFYSLWTSWALQKERMKSSLTMVKKVSNLCQERWKKHLIPQPCLASWWNQPWVGEYIYSILPSFPSTLSLSLSLCQKKIVEASTLWEGWHPGLVLLTQYNWRDMVVMVAVVVVSSSTFSLPPTKLRGFLDLWGPTRSHWNGTVIS